jgi:hypothetical protein
MFSRQFVNGVLTIAAKALTADAKCKGRKAGVKHKGRGAPPRQAAASRRDVSKAKPKLSFVLDSTGKALYSPVCGGIDFRE